VKTKTDPDCGERILTLEMERVLSAVIGRADPPLWNRSHRMALLSELLRREIRLSLVSNKNRLALLRSSRLPDRDLWVKTESKKLERAQTLMTKVKQLLEGT